MSFKQLTINGKIQKQKTSKEEIADLFKLIARDLQDASIDELSEDRRFAIAYNAVLQCATMIMRCLGYRTKGEAHHYTTFEFLRLALGKKHDRLIDYFNSCRSKRNRTDYDAAGEISETEVGELLSEARKFFKFSKDWIAHKYPQYLK